MKKIISNILMMFLISSMTNYSLAWGITGHRTIGKVAENHLNRKVKKKIESILQGQSLAEVSNWMDDIKSDKAYDSLRSWHYTTIPDGMKYSETEVNPEGDVVQGINFLVEQLKSGKLSSERERDYLRLLVHLVGDIHQPLHVGNGTDKGGNDVKVEWFWESSNLHRVWDSGMIESMEYSYTELAEVVDNHTREEAEKWTSSSVVDWAHEAMTFRDGIYDLPEDKKINYSYRYEHWDTVKLQLLKGGIRLAALLEEIYG
ncbi:MAG: S1/P1 nuclease [Brumimicrobium sp.]|nr:S1/P1 nuclease [Brumimicrobium sp.]